MQKLDEFRVLNERVKAGAATAAELTRWQALKVELIHAIHADTPSSAQPFAK